jgi:hypothetical protein
MRTISRVDLLSLFFQESIDIAENFALMLSDVAFYGNYLPFSAGVSGDRIIDGHSHQCRFC